MPHILQEYAKHCGVKVGEPVVSDHFFPLHATRYITLDITSVGGVSWYRYWNDVVALFKSSLTGKPIKVVSLVSDKSPPIGEDIRVGGVSVKQLNHIIKDSMLHLSVDGPTSHIASAYGVPQVVLYSNSRPEYNGPYWNVDKVKYLLPKYKNDKPSFLPEENPPVVNTIYPDKILEAIGSFLPESKLSHKVHYIGDMYHHRLMEVVPDFTGDVPQLADKLLNIRMDLHFDEKNLSFWLARNRASIITSQPISGEILRQFKTNVLLVNFYCHVGQFPSLEYLKNIQNLGININLFSHDGESEGASKELNKYFDFKMEISDPITEFPFEFREGMKFRTNKAIFCKDGIFRSRFHMNMLDNSDKVIDNKDFIKELEHFYIYD